MSLVLDLIGKYIIYVVVLIVILSFLFVIWKIRFPLFFPSKERRVYKAILIEKEKMEDIPIEELCEKCEERGKEIFENLLCYVIKLKKENDLSYSKFSICKNLCSEKVKMFYIAFDVKENRAIIAC